VSDLAVLSGAGRTGAPNDLTPPKSSGAILQIRDHRGSLQVKQWASTAAVSIVSLRLASQSPAVETLQVGDQRLQCRFGWLIDWLVW
jgi:hypothetical protein